MPSVQFIRVGLPALQRAKVIASDDLLVSDLDGLEIGRLLRGDICRVYPGEPARFSSVDVLSEPPGREALAGLEPFTRRLYLREPGGRDLYHGEGGVVLEIRKWRLELGGVRFHGPITIEGLPVGRGFPWEFQENATFLGETEIIPWIRGLLRPINIVEIEDYIASVVGSEIGGSAPFEAQKAQAVAARSTLFATYGSHHILGPFGICSEDHCQVYRGRSSETPESRRASDETKGLVLVYEGDVVDARFSKCCGGITEEFRGAWEDADVPYLISRADGDYQFPIETEDDAINFIENPPPANCSGSRNFRWEVRYSRQRLSEVVLARSGQDIGAILEINPLARGKSGRITRLALRGERGEMILSPELEIRRVLSETYLNSSCFHVLKEESGFVIRGAGWGHGVGMCQEGAVKMAEDGKDFRDILGFYYPGAEVARI
ncbi:MAG: SpoIID/LytB domain-containing protein [candidate division WOR-3 bacterium]